MKSGVSPQKLRKKQFLLANSGAISTNLGVLGLDLHSSSPERVNFFRNSPRLGGTNSHLGGHGPGMPPRGTRPALMGTKGWFQRSGLSSFEFLLAEGDSVERSDHNVLQGTCCFQLSTAFPFYCLHSEVESSRTSLASSTSSRTHFEVLGLQA